MPKGRVAKVVPQCDCLGEILVESKRARDAPSNLRYFKRVCKPCTEVVTLGSEEDLRLVGQAPKALAVEDAQFAPVSPAEIYGNYLREPDIGAQ